jgi:hypothetical protein
MDGSWIGVVVDFQCELLTRYAEEADAEILANPFQAKQYGIDLSNQSDNQRVENAQTNFESLFRRLQQCDNPAPNNRKFSCNFLALHIIKV